MKNIFSLLILLSLVIFQTSCKKEVSGCTDPLADNYNGDASLEDNTCTYQLRFAGNYDGVFDCKGQFAALFSEAELSISELPVKNELNIIIQTAVGPLPVKGIITAFDTVTVDATLSDIEVDPEIFVPNSGSDPIKAKGTVKTKLSISADNKTITGILNLSMTNQESIVISGIPLPPGFIKLDDSCNFVATKE